MNKLIFTIVNIVVSLCVNAVTFFILFTILLGANGFEFTKNKQAAELTVVLSLFIVPLIIIGFYDWVIAKLIKKSTANDPVINPMFKIVNFLLPVIIYIGTLVYILTKFTDIEKSIF